MDPTAVSPPDVLPLSLAGAKPDITLRPPGSKSITNRALLCAALAPGRSRLSGALFAADTRAMLGAVVALGATAEIDEEALTVTVTGVDPSPDGVPAYVDARQSGTTSRFMLPAVSLSPARSVVDGSPQLRARPFGPLLEALAALGARVESLEEDGHLPVAVTGPARGGKVEIPGHMSSQFLSGLMMSAPLMPEGLDVTLTSPLVSVPYVTMTEAVMAAFGAQVEGLHVPPGRYQATDYDIEPDASAASYLFAAAALTGGRVTVEGLGSASMQGDVAFVDVLEKMGARVERSAHCTTVIGPPHGQLHGIDVDMADISDTAQTLATVAVFADGPTRVRGVGFIRFKETDRIASPVAELRRAGIEAVEHDDGFTINPGLPQPARLETYDDHRMAMSLALLALRADGIEIVNPSCVGKTYPGFFADLARLAGQA